MRRHPTRARVGRRLALLACTAVLGMATLTIAASPVAAGTTPDPQTPLSWAEDAPLLGIGATGAAVQTWQAAMNAWLEVVSRADKFRLVVDGVYGPLSDSVTRRFQFSQGLPVDGLVGPVTRAAYLSAPELVAAGRTPVAHEPSLGPGDRGDAVAAWQAALNRWATAAGTSAGPLTVDGAYGPETEQATRTFQQTQGITVDGLVGPETRAALASAPALVNRSPLGPPTPEPAPPSASTPAAGICSVDEAAVVEIVLAPDVATPRCVEMAADHRLRVVNQGDATRVALGAWQLDLDPGATVTSPLPVRVYAAPGVHTLRVARYGGSGPDVRIR